MDKHADFFHPWKGQWRSLWHWNRRLSGRWLSSRMSHRVSKMLGGV